MPAYASYLKGKYSATTARNYMQHIKYFIEQCPHPSPEDIRTADIQAYIDKLGESTKTKGSRYSILMGVKKILQVIFRNNSIV